MNPNLNFDQNNHKQFCLLIKSKLEDLIRTEPLLQDLSPNINSIELKNILSLEHGESMNLFIRRADNQIFNVIVKQNATVKELKESIQNYYKLKHEKDPNSCPKAINWKYTWKNYCLVFENEKLMDNDKQLRDYGIRTKHELRFFRYSFRKR